MRAFKKILALLACGVLVLGCDRQAMLEKLIPKDEVAIAQQIFSRIQARDYAEVESQFDADIQTPSARGALEQMAAMFPPEKPKSIRTVGAYTTTVNGTVTTYNLTFEQEYSNAWLLANAVLQRRDGKLTIRGLHVYPLKQPLEEANRFTFAGKGLLHYAILALVVAVPAFIIYALVLCIRTPLARRKWLWLLFIAVGIAQFSFNWTDGSLRVQPIYFSLLGAGFFRASPYAPFIFNVAIPVGAIVFLAKRRSLRKRTVDSGDSELSDTDIRSSS